MKYINFYLLFILFFNVQSSFSSDDLFKKGNDAFLSGKFKSAISFYNKIDNKNSNVWSNLGDAYFNNNDEFNAIKCWTKARDGASAWQLSRLMSNEDEALQKRNCAVVSHFKLWLDYLILISPISLFYFMLIFIYFIMIYLFYCRFRRFLLGKSLNLLDDIYQLLLLLGLLFAIYFFIHKNHQLKGEHRGIASSKLTTVYAGPEKTFHKKKVIPFCSVVRISEERNGMVKINSNDLVGWALKADFEDL